MPQNKTISPYSLVRAIPNVEYIPINMIAFTKTITRWLPTWGLIFLLSWQVAQAQQPEAPKEGATAADPALVAAGEALFIANCTSCHAAATDEVVVGPGLKGILERRSIEWLIPWIKNSQAVIASGDKYAVDLFAKYNKSVMTSFAFSDAEIKSIFAYVQSAKPPQKLAELVTPGGTTPPPSDGGYFNVLLVVLSFVLVLIFTVLILLLSVINRFLGQKTDLDEADKELMGQKFEPFKLFQSRPFVTGVTLLFVLILSKAGMDSMIDVGMQQGYAPTQPIPFSHKLHAGEYKIDCGYCHTGVYKGKSATIPSASTCMNCHNQIKRGSPEIQKIYTAIEKNRPIEWVRVHNLPDLAYFNHAQHTNVAGLECTKCHGEVAQMEVVQQRAPLTMGWCINCHRETVVEHANNNAYYDKLLAYHQKQGIKKMTVENIGGLECAKCHY